MAPVDTRQHRLRVVVWPALLTRLGPAVGVGEPVDGVGHREQRPDLRRGEELVHGSGSDLSDALRKLLQAAAASESTLAIVMAVSSRSACRATQPLPAREPCLPHSRGVCGLYVRSCRTGMSGTAGRWGLGFLTRVVRSSISPASTV